MDGHGTTTRGRGPPGLTNHSRLLSGEIQSVLLSEPLVRVCVGIEPRRCLREQQLTKLYKNSPTPRRCHSSFSFSLSVPCLSCCNSVGVFCQKALSTVSSEPSPPPHWDCEEPLVQEGKRSSEHTFRTMMGVYKEKKKVVALVALPYCHLGGYPCHWVVP
jgi:hypothetical protein